jgi:hypothetical protein
MKFMFCILYTDYKSILNLLITYVPFIYMCISMPSISSLSVSYVVICFVFVLFFFFICTGCSLLLHSRRISYICCHVLYLIVINFCKIALFTCTLACGGCVCDAIVSFEISLSINDRNNRVSLVYTILGHGSLK